MGFNPVVLDVELFKDSVCDFFGGSPHESQFGQVPLFRSLVPHFEHIETTGFGCAILMSLFESILDPHAGQNVIIVALVNRFPQEGHTICECGELSLCTLLATGATGLGAAGVAAGALLFFAMSAIISITPTPIKAPPIMMKSVPGFVLPYEKRLSNCASQSLLR